MIHFEKLTKDTLFIAHEMINSNPGFNILENGEAVRSIKEIENDLIHSDTESYLIMDDDTYIGIIGYLLENSDDQKAWIGLLLIHGDYQGYGYGTQSYALFEKEFIKQDKKSVHIGVMKENSRARSFWKELGFTPYKTVTGQAGNEIVCYEKSLIH